MTTAATSLLGLALPVTGELSGVWGQTVNDSITTLLDSAVAGTTTLSTDGDVTLTTTTLASNQARQAILLCSGARTALRTITAPAQSKIYTIINATTGGFSVKLVGVGPTTGLTIPNGASAVVAWNGSDFIEIGSSTVGNLVVNGNLTVTGTTTLTGAATLTANPTLSAGTANGVAYLNGSKVVTTGSALTFDGTTLTNTRNTTDGSAAALTLNNSGTTGSYATLNQNAGTVTYQQFVDAAGNAGVAGMTFRTTSNHPLVWGVNSAEQMRLTSTGLGIGTSSPVSKLNAVGTTGINWVGGGNSYGLVTFGTQGSGGALWVHTPSVNASYASGFAVDGTYDSGTGKSLIRLHALGTASGGPYNSDMAFFTSIGVTEYERMRIDSSGNLGLGVTPSAWSGLTSFSIASTGSNISSASNDNLFFTSGAYYNGTNWIYKATSQAVSSYQQLSGIHRWNIAASGTAGNAITFTQAMTLDASGNLGVGTTSPKANGGYATFTLNNATNGGVVQYCQNDTTIGQLFFDGNGGTLRTVSNTSMVFGTNNTERARFTSGGYFCVGSTTDTRNIFAGADTSLSILTVRATASSGVLYGINANFNGQAPNNTTSFFLQCNDTGAERATIRSNGGIANYQANDVNLSDRREKTNFAPAGEYLSKICAIPVQTFNYIDQNMEEDAGLTLGVVAQDVQAVAPELVTESNWGTEEEPKMRLSIYQTDLQYALMKCIQEQQALITQLTERITALEGK